MASSAPKILSFTRAAVSVPLAAKIQPLGFALEAYEHIDSLLGSEQMVVPNEPGEPIHGRDGVIFEAVVQRQPLLIVFDAENEATPWRRWVAILKSSAATRRIPIILIADEVQATLRHESKNYGADLLAPTARFVADALKIIQKFDRRPDQNALATACQEPLSELALAGIALFNRGAYFEAHEELEHAWNEDQGPARELYRGILQVGIAYLQIERGNFNGAVKMLLRVKQWLDPLPARCRSVDVEQLRQDAAEVYAALQQAGPEGLSDFDRRLFKPLIYDPNPPS